MASGKAAKKKGQQCWPFFMSGSCQSTHLGDHSVDWHGLQFLAFQAQLQTTFE